MNNEPAGTPPSLESLTSAGGVSLSRRSVLLGALGGAALLALPGCPTDDPKSNHPVVGLSPTRTGRGYHIVATDGGVFTLGDAAFHGSAGSRTLNAPVVGIAAHPTKAGYWLVAGDGGVFTYGEARFHGSTVDRALNKPVVAMAPTPSVPATGWSAPTVACSPSETPDSSGPRRRSR